MPIEFLPHLRLLRHSLSLMRLEPPIHSSRAIPVLSCMFPFKLRYNALGPRFCNQLRVRRLSNRSFRPRAVSGSEFSRGGRERGGEVRASKSLIDDEAELSDWVSDLGKTDSFRGRIGSDDDDLDDRGRGRGRSRNRGGERNRNSFAMKRKRESDSDEFFKPTTGKSRNLFESRNGDSFAMKARRESDSDDFRHPSRGRTGNSLKLRNRDSSKMKMRREIDPGQQSRGRTSNSFDSRYSQGTKRFDSRSNGGLGWRDTGLGNRKRNLKQSSDENDSGDDDDKLESLRVGFQDLLSEDTDEDGDDGDNDDDFLKKSRVSLFGMDKEVSPSGTPSSPGKSGSYLSETR